MAIAQNVHIIFKPMQTDNLKMAKYWQI